MAGSQLNLFDNPAAPTPSQSRRESKSAKRDAHRGSESFRKGQTVVVLDQIKLAGKHGLTRHELADALGIPVSSACGRVNELLNEPEPVVFIRGRRDGRSIVLAKGYA